ncbi:MAG: cobalt ECF transporter T component CbiQ [Nitrospirota bacterium]
MANNIPGFLLERPSYPLREGRSKRFRRSFLDKGIGHLAGVIKTSFVQWEMSSRDGLLQGIDPRVKVLFLVVFLLLVTIKKDFPAEGAIALSVFVLAAASRLDLAVMYRRVLFFGFVFGFLVAFPSSVNIITPGHTVWPIVTFDAPYDFWIYHVPDKVGLTREGLLGVAMLSMRVVNCLSLTLLVLYTTPFPEITRTLKLFRAPDAFLVIISLSYKYIFIFARTVEDMYLAKKSRHTGAVADRDARSWVAGRMAMMFRKTQIRCEEIFRAMLSRGFTGEVRLQGFGRLRAGDYTAGAVFLLIGAAVVII